MATNIVSLDTLDVKFADFITEISGLGADKVLISYADKGQAFGGYDENVCYVKTFDESNDVNIYKQRTSVYNADTEQYTYTQRAMRTLMLHIVIYGKQSDELVTLINESFYLNKGKDFLYQNNLAIIPDKTSSPARSFEEIGGRFWHRSDLKIYFYNSTSIEEVIDTIKELDIHIKRS